MVRIIIIIAIMAIGGIVSFFTVSSKDVLRYNDSMVALAGEVDGSFAGLTPFMSDYGEDKTIDITGFKTAIDHTGQVIAEKMSVLRATKVPDDQVCRTFNDSLIAYVSNSQQLQVIYAGDVFTYVSAHNPATAGDSDAAGKFLEPLIAKDTELLQVVKTSQQAMATKFKMKLE